MDDPNDNEPQISFHYIKSKSFRVIHVDGAWGGTNPKGYITIAFFSERSPIPRQLTYDINKDGDLGDLVYVDTKEGVIREVEVEVVLDLESTKGLIQWLQDRVEMMQELNQKGNQE